MCGLFCMLDITCGYLCVCLLVYLLFHCDSIVCWTFCKCLCMYTLVPAILMYADTNHMPKGIPTMDGFVYSSRCWLTLPGLITLMGGSGDVCLVSSGLFYMRNKPTLWMVLGQLQRMIHISIIAMILEVRLMSVSWFLFIYFTPLLVYTFIGNYRLSSYEWNANMAVRS